MTSVETFIAAARNNDCPSVQNHLSAGIDVNAVFEGTTALYEACKNNNLEIVRLLVESGATPDIQTKIRLDKTQSPYKHFWKEYEACWVFLRDYPLMLVCESGNMELVELLLHAGAEVNVNRSLYIEAIGGKMTGDMPDAHHTLSSPLKLTVERGNKAMLELLLKHASGKGLSLSEEENPLEAAQVLQKQEFIDLLLQAGYSGAYGGDDLITAAKTRDLPLVTKLLKRGIPADSSTALGKTALMWAAQNDDSALSALLLRAGADANKKDSNGKSARDIAEENGCIKIQLLFKTAELFRREK